MKTKYCHSRPERLIKIIPTRYFLVIKEINKYLVDMILINSFRSGYFPSQIFFKHLKLYFCLEKCIMMDLGIKKSSERALSVYG
jgi:hypothetical protein